MEESKNCPVCGIPAEDGKDDQVVLWGWGVHDAGTDSFKEIDTPQHEMVILHKDCLPVYVEGQLVECRVKSKSN